MIHPLAMTDRMQRRENDRLGRDSRPGCGAPAVTAPECGCDAGKAASRRVAKALRSDGDGQETQNDRFATE